MMSQTPALAAPSLGTAAAKVAAAVALLILSAKTTVPFWPVPMTMQVAAVFLIAGVGGLRLASTSLMAYLAAGALGLPVFAGTPEKGIGLAYMIGATGGYLMGFLLAATLVGWARDRFGKIAAIALMPVGLAIVYALGAAWLAQFVPADKVLAYGVTPFLLGDLCKIALAGLLTLAAPQALRNFAKV
jgi:biotin transport system substrate-specific component